MVPIQIELCQKQKTFSEFFTYFLKSIRNFKFFRNKNDPQRFCISDITESENVVR